MSANTVNNELYLAQATIKDPGNAGTIVIEKSLAVCNLVSVAAETRTLGRPTRQGVQITLHMMTDGGDIALTVTGGYNEDGDTTFNFTDPGQFLKLDSFYDGTAFYWRKTSDYGMGNIAPGDASVLESFSALTATPLELNQAIGDGDEIVTTTNVINASENGSIYYLSLAGGFTSTLPAPSLGLRFRFIVKTAPTTAYIITTTGAANILFGMMEERAGGPGVAGAAKNTFNFVANQAKVGDWVDFYCDGTNYYYRGMVDVSTGNTVA